MIYDLAIVGGGPAGLSAALYAARFRMNFVVLAREPGGTVMNTPLMENWPGDRSVSGADLMDRMQKHAEGFGAEIRQSEVSKIAKKDKAFTLLTDSGEIEARTVLLATGTRHRKLNVPGEEEFHGRGVSYCAVCDCAFFRDKTVAVIGGSDSAAVEALLLAEYAKKVYMIYRKEKIRAEPITVEKVEKNKKIEVITGTNVTKISGGKFVKSVTLDRPHKGSSELPLDGVFIDIGYDPESGLAAQLGAKLDAEGNIIVNQRSETSVQGLYAAGDVTSGSFKQAITAAAQGVTAVNCAYNFLEKKCPA
jgi:thioredoxin reductase (NADPH)